MKYLNTALKMNNLALGIFVRKHKLPDEHGQAPL